MSPFSRPAGAFGLGAALLAGAFAGIASPHLREEAREPEFSGLVVLVVVDQLPQYLLEHYAPHFKGGFRRLLDEGRVYSRASHDHARTSTAPGHTSIAAGVHPFRHGIVGNAWREPVAGRWVDVENFSDSTERILGRPALRGFSPRKLEATTLADWILEADPEARVFSVSGKVRAAVPLAGRAKGHVYVLNDDFGPAFVTSTYYRDEEPEWVRRFNEGSLTELLADSVWDSTVPEGDAWASRPDTTEYERGGRQVAFPHAFVLDQHAMASEPLTFLEWFGHTPALDEASIALAIEAVETLGLGRRSGVDLVGLALSATDRIGHMFGPFSREQLDNLLRLDHALGELFAYLDGAVGRERYLVALSSDHGVLAAPEHRAEMGGIEGGRVAPAAVLGLIRSVDTVIADPGAELHARRAAVLERSELVADAMTVEELLPVNPSIPLTAARADSFLVLFRRSFHPDRAISLGDRGVYVRVREGYTIGTVTATHGSPYYYDRHVPLVFMGPGVEPGWTDERAATVDVAPTLARLAGVPAEGELDGRPLIDP